MKNPAETRYFETLDAFRHASAAHRAVTLRYRNREIDEAPFLASLRTVEAVSRSMDEAEALYLSSVEGVR